MYLMSFKRELNFLFLLQWWKLIFLPKYNSQTPELTYRWNLYPIGNIFDFWHVTYIVRNKLCFNANYSRNSFWKDWRDLINIWIDSIFLFLVCRYSKFATVRRIKVKYIRLEIKTLFAIYIHIYWIIQVLYG